MPFEAAIFDLDGTILDNNPFHIEAWKYFYKKLNRTLSDEEYLKNFNGKTNADVLNYVFAEKRLTPEQILEYTNEKEALYRQLYHPHIKPVAGLMVLLDELKLKNIPLAIATSGIPANIDYMFEHVEIRDHFPLVINNTHITKGKPDPEIYLLTAQKLNVAPYNCVAFEDSLAGIRSAKDAGMKVIAIATTHPPAELQEANLIVKNFSEVNFGKIAMLFHSSSNFQ